MWTSPTPMTSGVFERAWCGSDWASIWFSASSTRKCGRWTIWAYPTLKLLTRYQNGLILVTGSVGSGKSTTLAALVEQINLDRREHIITLEDPIEYIFEPKGCHITQREVHTHTRSFGAALARRAPRRSGRDHGGRDARSGDDLTRDHRFGNGASGSWAHCIPVTLAHARSTARCFPGRSTGADPHHGERIAARHHQPAASSATDGAGASSRWKR